MEEFDLNILIDEKGVLKPDDSLVSEELVFDNTLSVYATYFKEEKTS